jgi:hypothetical protein
MIERILPASEYVTKTGLTFDIPRIQKEYETFVAKYPFGKNRHIHLTHHANSKNHLFGDGDTYIERNENGKIVDDNNFDILNDEVRGTIFESIIKFVSSRYRIGKVKLVKIPPKFIYRMHTDPNNHLHLPIYAEESGAIFGDKVYWLPADGSVYYSRTALNPHTFFNSSDSLERVHMMFSEYQDRSDPVWSKRFDLECS